MSEEEIAKLCQITNDKCISLNPNDEGLATWIDPQKLANLINA